MTRGIVADIIAVILSIAAMYAGLNSGIFQFGTTPELMAISGILGPFCSSLLILLIGDRISTKIDAVSADDIVKKLSQSAPVLQTITEFPSSDDAMDYLTSRLPSARIVLNTKISSAAIPPSRGVGKRYTKALMLALKKGLSYKDVISEGFSQSAKDLEDHVIETGQKGSYVFKTMQINAPCFLNFTILELDHDHKELIIGWATSEYFGGEQKAYKVLDKRLISYFEKYHNALFNGAKA